MAKNDKVLIDGILDERISLKLPSEKRDEAFEYFAFEQLLKNYDLSSDEIITCSVDGRNDGGIDGFFITINGHLLLDPESFNWPKSGAVLEVWIITCKHHDTFRQAPLDNLAASITELFDFTVESTCLLGEYSEEIIRFRENLKYAYRKVSPRLSQFIINFCYASRGDSNELGDSIVARTRQIVQFAKDAFNNCSSSFLFIGSSELIELYRNAPNFSLEIPFIEDLSSGQTYILLVQLKTYYDFIQDNGKLRRYLFDSNIRDFMGLNRVNVDIRETLLNQDSPDFWWLNNGVTILATGASVIGKSIQIQDIQIVNGLQTSESIFRYFDQGGVDINNRSVLVKVIVSKDNEVRDAIIRATNNQTSVELSSLHATDKIQRDVEDVLKQNDFYYERRINFYKNQGLSSDKIISPLYLASGYVSLILKAPAEATRLRSRFMRSVSSYEKVFSETTDLLLWPKIATILKLTDKFLESVRPSIESGSEHFLKSRRHVISFLTLSKIFESFNFSSHQLIDLKISKFNNDELIMVWNLFSNSFVIVGKRFKNSSILDLYRKASDEWLIKGIERFSRKQIPNFSDENKKQIYVKNDFIPTKKGITREFALLVNELLPRQPWKPGIGKEIISKLECSKSEYIDAVNFLIDEGIRHKQIDGVVYDELGNVLCFDEDRVDSKTMQLRNCLEH